MTQKNYNKDEKRYNIYIKILENYQRQKLSEISVFFFLSVCSSWMCWLFIAL